MAYKVYTTDALYALTRYLGGENGMQDRFYNILYPQPQERVNGNAIAASIIGRIAEKAGEE